MGSLNLEYFNIYVYIKHIDVIYRLYIITYITIYSYILYILYIYIFPDDSTNRMMSNSECKILSKPFVLRLGSKMEHLIVLDLFLKIYKSRLKCSMLKKTCHVTDKIYKKGVMMSERLKKEKNLFLRFNTFTVQALFLFSRTRNRFDKP